MLIILLLMFSELVDAALDDVVFTESKDNRGYFSPENGFKCFLAGTQVWANGSLKKIRFYFKEDADEEKMESLVVWEDAQLYEVGRLKGKYISNQDIRILFHAARRDPESEGGHALISDIYSNAFALHGLSFIYGESKLNKKLFDLSNRIRAANCNDFLRFKEEL